MRSGKVSTERVGSLGRVSQTSLLCDMTEFNARCSLQRREGWPTTKVCRTNEPSRSGEGQYLVELIDG